MLTRSKRALAAVIATGALAALALAGTAAAKDKKKVAKLDELPRYTYEVTGKASDILASDEAFAELAARVRKDIEDVLDTYEIEDANTLQQYYTMYQTILMMDGEYDKALDYLEKARALEQKEARKLTMGLLSRSYVETMREGTDPSSEAFGPRMSERYAERIKALPWEKVQDVLQGMNGQMQMISESMLVGLIQSQLDPAVEKSGYLSGDQARQLIRFRGAMVLLLPYKDDIAAVIGETVAAHQEEEKADIWPARSVTLDAASDKYSPVVVGVWDAGVDTEVFKGQLFTNPKEKVNKRDDDRNGYVDDIHGIAYDLQHDKTTDLLYPLGDHASKRAELEKHLKGFSDLTSAIESPEADAVKMAASQLDASQVQPFFESLSLYSHYAHGTHVAGIAVEGNPHAQVLTARLSFDHRMVPMPYTVELTKKFGKEFRETAKYFKENDVRVVNMSWGFSVKEIEGTLEANGIGESAEERGKMAREMFKIARTDLYEAFQDASDVLFVAAAGNSDNDVEFDEFIPSSFDLPNLLITGAVDQAGEATGFTSGGRTVKVYANGFEVDSYVPGGNRMKLSGTSMASPNVANLAAKLIARDPSLKPREVIELIVAGADDFGEDEPMWVINPKRSMEMLEDKVARRSG